MAKHRLRGNRNHVLYNEYAFMVAVAEAHGVEPKVPFSYNPNTGDCVFAFPVDPEIVQRVLASFDPVPAETRQMLNLLDQDELDEDEEKQLTNLTRAWIRKQIGVRDGY